MVRAKQRLTPAANSMYFRRRCALLSSPEARSRTMKHISSRPDVEHHLFAELLTATADDRPQAEPQAGSATAGASAISTVSAAAFCRRESARNGTASAEMPAPTRYDGA